jgi:superoxide reductase
MRLFKCEICGNIVELINDGGGTLVCCGQEMAELKINTEETTFEKHIPIVTKEGDMIKVDVGSIAHPMIENHYIEWIALVEKNRIQKVLLNPNDKPTATFETDNNEYEVYAYCNIHGFYKAK